MAICIDCARAADTNRGIFNTTTDYSNEITAAHPTDCNCMCAHQPIAQWEKRYTVEEPSETNS